MSVVIGLRPQCVCKKHDAARIDIGPASHFVAVSPDRDDEPVRECKSFTKDLEKLADWLMCCGADTVAME